MKIFIIKVFYQKKLDVHKFKKYNFDEYLYKHIQELNVLNVNYDVIQQ